MMTAETTAAEPAAGAGPSRWTWGAAWALLAALFVALAHLAIHSGARPIADDAAIDFRYVDMVLGGHGIVYNVGGPHVYGASSLPYMLLLAALHRAGVGLVSATLVLNIGGLGVSTALLFLLCARPTAGEDAALPPLLAVFPSAFALSAATVLEWSSQGLECGFHLMLGVAAVWAFARRRPLLCGVFLGLALADKLDAGSLAVGLGVVALLRDRRQARPMLAGAACVFGPWVLFTWLYFGSPVPMSLQAKQLHDFAAPGHAFLHQYLQDDPQHLRVLLLALGGLLLARQRWVQALGLWLAAYIAIYDHVTRGFAYPWYYFVSNYLLYALGGLGLARFVADARLRAWLGAPLRAVGLGRAAAPAAAALTAGAAAWVLYAQAVTQIDDVHITLQKHKLYAASVEADRVAVGDFVHHYAAPAESIVAGHGWPAYLSGTGMTVYDGCGLNDPAYVAADRQGRVDQYVRRNDATYVEEMMTDGAPPPDRYVLIATWDRSRLNGSAGWRLWGHPDCHAVRALRGARLPLAFH